MVRSWCDFVLHGTELMRFGMLLVWFCKVILCTLYNVHCTVVINLVDFFTKCKEIHQIPYVRTQPWLMTCKTEATLFKSTKVTLRSWCDLVKWPYGVKKIRIRWLWPVKVTLEVIKRRLKIFGWSCDEGCSARDWERSGLLEENPQSGCSDICASLKGPL
jgi:hypothetical protein